MPLASSLPVWWLCTDPAHCVQVLDERCELAHMQGEHPALIDGAGTSISNLSVAENILLPGAWHTREARLRPQVRRWLETALAQDVLDQVLALRPAMLSPRDRQRATVARAIQLQAGCVLVDDDLHSHERWLDEWLDAIERELPRARIEVISARLPLAPQRWQVQSWRSKGIAA